MLEGHAMDVGPSVSFMPHTKKNVKEKKKQVTLPASNIQGMPFQHGGKFAFTTLLVYVA
jgi:hypothetical protein